MQCIFFHPEKLLLAMIIDERSYISELGFRQILQAWKRVRERVGVFHIPVSNFNKQYFIDLIQCKDCENTSPTIL